MMLILNLIVVGCVLDGRLLLDDVVDVVFVVELGDVFVMCVVDIDLCYFMVYNELVGVWLCVLVCLCSVDDVFCVFVLCMWFG